MPIHEHIHPRHPSNGSGVMTALAKSSFITGFIGAAMIMAGIPLTTVLPTSAPIWMGFAMLFSRK